MRHYEIVLLIDPNQSDQVFAMVQRYTSLVEKGKEIVHRLEDWGRRQLAYPIRKLLKAHYVLMNIECRQKTISELRSSFCYNDAVLRHLILQRDRAITEPSPLAKIREAQGQEECTRV